MAIPFCLHIRFCYYFADNSFLLMHALSTLSETSNIPSFGHLIVFHKSQTLFSIFLFFFPFCFYFTEVFPRICLWSWICFLLPVQAYCLGLALYFLFCILNASFIICVWFCLSFFISAKCLIHIMYGFLYLKNIVLWSNLAFIFSRSISGT